MSKKGSHPLLTRLLAITARRLPFTPEVTRLKRQHHWLIELERHWAVPADQTASRHVQHATDQYLHTLSAQAQDADDMVVVTHMDKTIRSLWWGLFPCYDVPGLPRTNNGLERFMRLLKTAQRRITGRQQVQDFIIRYGEFVTCVDYNESLPDLLHRLATVSQADFLQERQRLNASLLREAKRQRFRQHRIDVLHSLEERWARALAQNTS